MTDYDDSFFPFAPLIRISTGFSLAARSTCAGFFLNPDIRKTDEPDHPHARLPM